jgi:LysR family glycine cleavage system transcriptional activator
MAARSAAPPRLLRAVEPSPAATRLRPALLLSLQAFDAVVRLQSFKAAAEALHLTPSAISHRIRNLERAMGTLLFVRAHRAVQATPAARALATATGRAFAEMVRATTPLVGAEASLRLRLNVSPLFATAWLIPRLRDFIASHPSIELVIEHATRRLDLDNDVFHAAVRVGDGQWPGLKAHHLMALQATPVMAPELLRKLKLRRPADLARVATIHVSAFPLAWPMWLSQAGVGETRPRQTVWVDSFDVALQLAEQGAGVALGLSPLFAQREASGTLCRPFDATFPTGAYWLVHRPEEEGHPALRLFTRWLRNRLAADG